MSQQSNQEPKIYLLPNMMTAGNLLCGFFAVLTIFKGMHQSPAANYDFSLAYPYYQQAIVLIFCSCIFDLLDGRMARLVGHESPFGREFDSLADIVSFGMAPALLLSKAVLFEIQPSAIGWSIAALYLLCGAMRLARFNCLAGMPEKDKESSSDFIGLPIPMAAGCVASVVFFIMHIYAGQQDADMGRWKYLLAAGMVGLALLMISKVKYPSFKTVSWRTKGSLKSILGVCIFVILIWQFYWLMPVLMFGLYLVYGLIRPWISNRWQKAIEEHEEN